MTLSEREAQEVAGLKEEGKQFFDKADFIVERLKETDVPDDYGYGAFSVTEGELALYFYPGRWKAYGAVIRYPHVDIKYNGELVFDAARHSETEIEVLKFIKGDGSWIAKVDVLYQREKEKMDRGGMRKVDEIASAKKLADFGLKRKSESK